MSWNEKLFGAFYHRFKSKSSKYEVTLEPLLPHLKILASALAGKPIEILPTRQGLGETRQHSLVLPNTIAIFKDKKLNEKIYLCRVAFSALAIQRFPVNIEDFPGLKRDLFRIDQAAKSLSISLEDWLILTRGTSPQREINSDENPTPIALESPENKNQKTATGQPSLAKIKSLEISNTNPAVHVFEKLLTAEDYQGGQRDIDSGAGDSDMSQALSELNMNQVVKATGETGSTYHASLVIDGANQNSHHEEPSLGRHFQYPEWSRKQLRFLPNWCTVYEQEALSASNPVHAPLKESKVLKRQLEILTNKPIWVRGQPEGSEFDLEAIVRWKTDLRAKTSFSHSLFMERQRLEQDIAVLILADTSLSTDSWVANQRVLDTIQQSLHMITQTLRDLLHPVSMAAFFSNTRHQCTYLRMKDFTDDWKHVPARISGLKPQGYTRIGPAIRHATKILKNIKTRKKLLLVISDSKPTDYDAYEGMHGEADVHHAVLEARIKNITVKGLAVANKNFGLAKRLYGQGGFETFTDANRLSHHIIRAYCEALHTTIISASL